MSQLSFEIELRWSGTGPNGFGELNTPRHTIAVSAPEEMGGRGIGTNPEELLVSAVASCYGATLSGVLNRSRLPVDAISVSARGIVGGFPGNARFERLVVNPVIVGGAASRRDEYENAARRAHDRCLIGRALAPDVSYEVGSVEIEDSAGAASQPALATEPAA
jgi:peroxiredoxin-like protein